MLHRINAVEQTDTDLRLCPKMSYHFTYFVHSVQSVIASHVVLRDSFNVGVNERLVTIFY